MMRRVGALLEERHAVRRGLYNVLFLQKQNWPPQRGYTREMWLPSTDRAIKRLF